MRSAVSGYRDVTLAGELARGRELLRASGIAADLPTATDVVDPAHQELFGWTVREGLTNVVRHARASSCAVRLSRSAIEIVDDGVGEPPRDGDVPPGNGLSGLRERVARRRQGRCRPAAGGRLAATGHAGTRRRQVTARIRLLLADDQELIRGALGVMLALEDDFEVVASVGRGDEVVAAAKARQPDVALLDIEMPGIDGLAVAGVLAQEVPALPVAHPYHVRPPGLPAAGDGVRRVRFRGQGRPAGTAGRRDPPRRRRPAGR